MSLAEHLVLTYRDRIKTLTLEPSHGGVFDVWIDGEQVFAKREMGRFPTNEEIGAEIQARMTGEG